MLCGSLLLMAAAAPAQTASQPAGTAGLRQRMWPPKTSRSLLRDDRIARARQLCRADARAARVLRATLSRARPWTAFSDEQLRQLLPDGRVCRAVDVSFEGCPVHGTAVFKFGTYPWKLDPAHPYTLTCPVGGERYPSNDFEAFYRGGMTDRSLLTGPYPDDGRGWRSPSGEKHWFVAHACHGNWQKSWIPAVVALSQAYVLTGERIYAQRAAAMLDRIAEVYPGMDYNTQSRLGEQRAERKGTPYDGKILMKIWETKVFRDLVESYDRIFDSLVGDQAIALSWRSAADIRANIEANLVEEGIDAIKASKIRGNFGMHQSALAVAAAVRQTGEAPRLIEGILTETGGDIAGEGLNYALYNFVFKDGMPNESSPYYASTWVDQMALLAEAMHLAGVDLYKLPKLRRMFDAPLDLLCAGSFT
ncbi:MAG: hypothetical protein HY718_09780, partial [Planctomycetes bacterium]|nr:hypothetical protein [Planctomycetota bacterium]